MFTVYLVNRTDASKPEKCNLMLAVSRPCICRAPSGEKLPADMFLSDQRSSRNTRGKPLFWGPANRVNVGPVNPGRHADRLQTESDAYEATMQNAQVRKKLQLDIYTEPIPQNTTTGSQNLSHRCLPWTSQVCTYLC